MPTAGMSLFGFYTSDVAAGYLTNVCRTADTTPEALHAAWAMARERLGAPKGRPGVPAMLPLPTNCKPYLAKLYAAPLMARFEADFGECMVKLVEIRPVLSIQPHVERLQCAASHRLKGAGPQQLLEKCLPLEGASGQVKWEQESTGRGLLIRHPDFNLQTFGGAGVNTPEGALVAGPIIGVGAPWTQAMEIDGRVYLRNGYHRAVGLMEAGHTHMPCLTFKGHRSQLGVAPAFGDDVMLSANPATVGHFAADRATEVQLRKGTKVIAISWAEFLVVEQD